MRIRQKLILIWAPMVLCLVPILHGCGSRGSTDTTTTSKTTTTASSGNATKTGDASTGFAPDKVPSTPELTELTKESLLAWNEAIQAKDFTKFYPTVSKALQKQTTPEKMAAAFKPITDENEKGTDIEPFVTKMEPVFTPAPAINSDGVLVVKGYYPSAPSRTTFTLKYIDEGDAWKLIGINVNFDKAPDAKMPSTPEVTELTKETLLAWNEGIQAKDFTKFYATISNVWQMQTTPEKLAAIFKPITDNNEKGTNIEPLVTKMEPVFTPAPAINSDGVLVVEGYYPSTPDRTTFTLKYLAEADAWKLVGINVDFPFQEVPAGDAKDAPAEDAPAKDTPAEDAPAKDTP